jgi:hypothetical protein
MTHVLRLSLPFTVWLVGFCALYALQGVSCSRLWPESLDARLVLMAAATMFVMLQAAVLARILAAPTHQPFVQTTTAVLGAAALGAAVWTSLPVVALTVCG